MARAVAATGRRADEPLSLIIKIISIPRLTVVGCLPPCPRPIPASAALPGMPSGVPRQCRRLESLRARRARASGSQRGSMPRSAS
ncbi:hypothetical protein BOSE62_160281 [Bosea sp. 62]|nr:hypothetical protein BOSE46_10034 [Bosea sp. 46]CAD5248234.1 hypothetical protein BOSE21B_10240 [Bosea sp. 21B]CAD5267732.1 hypothetical protein BOSE7B_150898 [Bosea sp. 7B]VVT45533.1 hypothetical protein BOS5A_10838 [Bosea sp. EC-HK365B]VXA93946.1 hypothetical protein BOSE29B_10034 [Bosea sp. 29B]VXA94499.1 hypothetical protein BOSE125_10034 [Bosea sp. 125]VXB95400.1 hypothetical protein BOSE62_160281 [Bosea sp. 62]VXC57867.1 hypothetical protein BOSE127_190526 [Bosea sp. 127]